MNQLHLQYKSELTKLKEELINAKFNELKDRSPSREYRQ